MAAAAEVERARGSGDRAGRDRAQVVGVDLLPDAQVLLRIDAQHGGEAAEGFGEGHRGATVQHAVGLVGVRVHRHGGAQEVLADLGVADPEESGHDLLPWRE